MGAYRRRRRGSPDRAHGVAKRRRPLLFRLVSRVKRAVRQPPSDVAEHRRAVQLGRDADELRRHDEPVEDHVVTWTM